MPHQPATIAPPVCGRCGADDELIPVTDPDGSFLRCRLCVIALVGSTVAPLAVLLHVAPVAGGGYWGCFVCGKEIPEPQVYCSAKCRAAEEGRGPATPTAGLCQWLCGAPECRRSGCGNR